MSTTLARRCFVRNICISSPQRFSIDRRPRSQICALRYASQQFGPFGTTPGLDQDKDDDDEHKHKSKGYNESSTDKLKATLYKMFESAATTFASIAVLGLAGYSYHKYYKHLVLQKMENAFKAGDPVLELSGFKSPSSREKAIAENEEADSEHWILRDEQHKIDDIVSGDTKGHYYLLIGEKGTGKSSMLLEAMRKIDGEGVSMFEAHGDLEIFRIRLGKSLDFEYHEDYIGSLFSIRGPRDTTALLDIERAFNKLEKVALNRRASTNKGPLILIVNCAHFVKDDEDGRDLLELMQQRAEQWSASNLVTMIFNSDDYWVYERLKRYATRMEVFPILDLKKEDAIAALTRYRQRYFSDPPHHPGEIDEVYRLVGGRLTYLNRCAKHTDMVSMAKKICEAEKTWFLNKCGILGESMDDDVMDQQKFASAAMVMAKALVDMEKESADGGGEEGWKSWDDQLGHILPQMPLYKARETMTRADFVQMYDHENIFTIDSKANVRADSVPMMHAFREICAEERFEQFLQDTLDRISAIESINRTKELTMKDLWIEQSGEMKGKYLLGMKDARGRDSGSMEFSYVKPPEEDDEEGDDKK